MLRFMGSQRAGHDWATELKTDIPLMVLQCRRPWLDSWASKIPCRRHRQSTPVLLGFPSDSVGKESTCNAGDPSLIPGSGSSPGEGIDYPLQYSWSSLMTQTIKNPPAMQETWVRSLGWEDPLEEGMATHSSILAWKIPRTWAWQATVHTVAKGRTGLKKLSMHNIPVKPPTSLRSWTEPTPLNVSSLPLYYHRYYYSCMWWERLTHAVPSGGSDGKESACNARDLIPGSGRSPGEGLGNPLLYSCLENPMDRGACGATVRGVTKSWTRLSNWHFCFHFHHPLKR